jgi:hypothetical protein
MVLKRSCHPGVHGGFPSVKAGIQTFFSFVPRPHCKRAWVPACAGMTDKRQRLAFDWAGEVVKMYR